MNARLALAAKFDRWAENGPGNTDCSVARIFDHVGDRWSMLLVSGLASGPHRFNELSRTIPGISRRRLTQTLRRLETEGLVHREVRPTMPPRVIYTLSDLGESFAEPALKLIEWAEGSSAQITLARARALALYGPAAANT